MLGIVHFGGFRTRHRLVGPMLSIFPALLNPATNQFNLRFGKSRSLIRGRHEVVLVIRRKPIEKLTRLGITWFESHVASQVHQSTLTGIEAKVGFALFLIRAVTGIAAIRQ